MTPFPFPILRNFLTTVFTIFFENELVEEEPQQQRRTDRAITPGDPSASTFWSFALFGQLRLPNQCFRRFTRKTGKNQLKMTKID